jgi:hypothetical protein
MANSSRNERIISRVRGIPKGFVRTTVTSTRSHRGSSDGSSRRRTTFPGTASSAPTAPFRKARHSSSYSSPKAFRCAASASTSTRHDSRESSEWPASL